MDIKLIFDFLRQLAAHNEREWFHEHKSLYQTASQEFDKLLTILIARIGEFDPSVRHLQPKDCTWRIYRDTLFTWSLEAASMLVAPTALLPNKYKRYAIPFMMKLIPIAKL